ncbi:sensor histidine kinase [Paenibacillus chitinolyticus]
MSIKRLSALFLAVILAILLINDSVFYYSTKKSLTANMETELFSLSQQIQLSIDHVEYSSQTRDKLLSDSLRQVALGVKAALPSRYRDIDNSMLAELRVKYNVSNLTLFAQIGDEIVSVRSSDPKEINLNAKYWGNYRTALEQLFRLETVTVSEGTTLQSFWAGKISGSASNPGSKRNKFGFYYDGTTDYIINPTMNSSLIEQFDQNDGSEFIVAETLKNNKSLLEITGFNPRTFSKPDDDPSFYTVTNGSKNIRYSERKILFGQYNNRSPEDVSLIEQAVKLDKPIFFPTKINDKNVLKIFYPVKSERVQFPYVIGLVNDMEYIHNSLNKQLLNFFLVIISVSIASLIMVYFIYKGVNRTKDAVAQTIQENYTDEMNSLMVAIKGQNHDFTNHLTTISCMVQLKKFDETKKYIHELVEETRLVNSIVHVGHPALASLISSKITQSQLRKINFTYELDLADDLTSISGLKSVDLVKILGNLIDNAFDEVSGMNVEQRNVHLLGYTEENRLIFKLSNHINKSLSEKDLQAMFTSGFSTKKDGVHKGLGLAIVNQLVQRYKGTVSAEISGANTIQFTVILPIYS